MTAADSRSRAAPDLRLLPPAAGAWAAAFSVVAAPAAAVPVAVGCWLAASALVVATLAARGTAMARLHTAGRMPGTRRRGWPAAAAVCLVAAALVASAVALQAPARQPASVVAAADHGRSIEATVVVGEAARGVEGAPVAATLVAAASGRERAVRASAPVLVFGELPESAGIGTTLRLRATLQATAPEDDVGFLLFAEGGARVVAGPDWRLDWANRLRGGFATAASRLPGDGGDLLPGLAIGDTSAVGEPLDAAMKAAALSHLTAVSGSNCAIVVALVVLLGALLGLPRGWRVAAAVAVLLGFVVLVTPQSSVVRASVMAAIVLLATGSGRPVRGVPVLCLAVLGLLVSDPWLGRDYGFALSVLATAGLLLLAGPFARLLARWLPRWLAVLIAVPLAAQLACQPVLLLLSPTIPLYGVVANALAEPAAPLATVLGLLACLALPLAPGLGGALAALAWLPAAWIAAVARYFSALPGAALPWPGGIAGVLLLVVVTAAALAFLLAGRTRRMRVAAGATALLLLVGLAGASAGIRSAQLLSRPADWQIAACDVGQGDAVVVRSASAVALVDTGPDAALLASCLDDLGIGRVDLLVLSHFDLDHVGGTSAVLGRVDRALVGPAGEPDDDRLVAGLRTAGAKTEQVSRGATGLLGELRWTVLWPRARLGAVEPGNAASVTVAFAPVGRCAGGCLSSLFVGDLGERSQEQVLAAGGVDHADVVKVAHHGSADQSARLYAAAAASVGVISVGADNDYGHPTAVLLDELAAAGTTAVRTDRSGLVLLAPGPSPGDVSVWTQRSSSGPGRRRGRGIRAPPPPWAATRIRCAPCWDWSTPAARRTA